MEAASTEASTFESRHLGISTYSDWSQPCWVSTALLWISFYLVGISCTDTAYPEACKQLQTSIGPRTGAPRQHKINARAHRTRVYFN